MNINKAQLLNSVTGLIVSENWDMDRIIDMREISTHYTKHASYQRDFALKDPSRGHTECSERHSMQIHLASLITSTI